jgi:transposase
LSKTCAGCTLGALNILDRFHIMRKFNEAIDEIRRGEVKRFKAKRQLCPNLNISTDSADELYW